MLAERFEIYLNQDIAWKAKTGGFDSYGQPAYAAATTIKGRKIGKRKLVVDGAGREITTESEITTQADISAGDFLDDKEVISVLEARNLDGSLVAKKAYL